MRPQSRQWQRFKAAMATHGIEGAGHIRGRIGERAIEVEQDGANRDSAAGLPQRNSGEIVHEAGGAA
jgi:hypothetical protein